MGESAEHRHDPAASPASPAGAAAAPAGRVPVGRVFDGMPLTRAHYKAGFALFFAFVIEAWEMLVISYVSGPVQRDFKVSTVEIGSLLSSLFFGMIPGALAWGPISERIGRKPTCICSLIAYGACTVASAVSVSFWMLWLTRFLAGFALAGLLVITFPYFEELLPVRYRGRASVYLAAGWPVGTLLAVGVSAAVLPIGWRWVLVASGLAGLWSVVVWRWVPESPYWLTAKGRAGQARDVLRSLGAQDPGTGAGLYVDSPATSSLRELVTGRTGMLTLVQVTLNFTFSWGFWGLQTWLPILLEHRGFSVNQSFGFIALTALFMIPGYLTASWLTSRYGRKRVFLVYVFLAAAGGIAFATATNTFQFYAGDVMLYFFGQGAWGVWDTWVCELYPTPLRALGNSWGNAGQRVANTVAPTVVGVLVAGSAGFSATVAFVDGFMFITGLLAFYFRETEGVQLA